MQETTSPSCSQERQRTQPHVRPVPPGTSEVLVHALRPYGVAVTHQPISTIGHYLHHLKDRRPKEKAQGLVHRIPCAECGKQITFPNVCADTSSPSAAVRSSTEKYTGGNCSYYNPGTYKMRATTWTDPPERCQAAIYTGYDAPHTKSRRKQYWHKEDNNGRLQPFGSHTVTREQGAQPASKRRAGRRTWLESAKYPFHTS